jgi:hypothetical protein
LRSHFDDRAHGRAHGTPGVSAVVVVAQRRPARRSSGQGSVALVAGKALAERRRQTSHFAEMLTCKRSRYVMQQRHASAWPALRGNLPCETQGAYCNVRRYLGNSPRAGADAAVDRAPSALARMPQQHLPLLQPLRRLRLPLGRVVALASGARAAAHLGCYFGALCVGGADVMNGFTPAYGASACTRSLSAPTSL